MISLRAVGRSAIALAALLTTVAGAAGAAQAAYTDLGLVTDTAGFGATATSTSSTSYDFAFTLGGASTGNAIDINATPIGDTLSFTSMAINLYKGTSVSGSPLTPSSGYFSNDTLNGLWTGVAFDNLAKGTYLIDVVATGQNGASFSGTLSVNPVPLPAALPLFGAALMGLGGLGWRRARKDRADA